MQSLNFSRERQEDKKIWLTGSKEWREKIGSFYSSQFSWRHRRTRFLGHISSLLFVFAVPTYALCQHNWPTIDRRLAHDPVLFLSEKFYVKHISHLTCEFRFEENIAHPHKHTLETESASPGFIMQTQLHFMQFCATSLVCPSLKRHSNGNFLLPRTLLNPFGVWEFWKWDETDSWLVYAGWHIICRNCIHLDK